MFGRLSGYIFLAFATFDINGVFGIECYECTYLQLARSSGNSLIDAQIRSSLAEESQDQCQYRSDSDAQQLTRITCPSPASGHVYKCSAYEGYVDMDASVFILGTFSLRVYTISRGCIEVPTSGSTFTDACHTEIPESVSNGIRQDIAEDASGVSFSNINLQDDQICYSSDGLTNALIKATPTGASPGTTLPTPMNSSPTVVTSPQPFQCYSCFYTSVISTDNILVQLALDGYLRDNNQNFCMLNRSLEQIPLVGGCFSQEQRDNYIRKCYALEGVFNISGSAEVEQDVFNFFLRLYSVSRSCIFVPMNDTDFRDGCYTNINDVFKTILLDLYSAPFGDSVQINDVAMDTGGRICLNQSSQSDPFNVETTTTATPITTTKESISIASITFANYIIIVGPIMFSFSLLSFS